MKENPYRIADDIWGIGFKTADTIAAKLGIEKDRYIRLRSGTLYTLNKLSESGHCCAVREQLITTAGKLLEVDTPELEATLDEMLRTKEVIKEDESIYLQPFYFAEAGCASLLKKLLHAERRAEIHPDQILSHLQPVSKNTTGRTVSYRSEAASALGVSSQEYGMLMAAEPTVPYGSRSVPESAPRRELF